MSNLQITSGGKAYHPAATTLLHQCFHTDPVLTFLLNAHPPPKRISLMPSYFDVLIKAAVLNDATITELGNWSSCAVWMPPGKSVDNWGTNFQAGFLRVLWDVGGVGCWHTLVDYQMTVDKVKNRELKKRGRFYYMFFIGTLPEAQGRGQGSRLIQHWTDKAGVEGISIWTEATTARSHRLYLRMGFVDVEEVRIGKGKAAADGTQEKDGEGVPIWTMIWLPPAQKEAESES